MADDKLMNATYALDIANSDDWNDAQWTEFCRDRLLKMRAKRAPFDKAWDEYQTQTTAVSFYDNEGNLQVNVPLEKTLGEIYMGRTNSKCQFDIVPDSQANVEELQPAKYAMQFFMDGNGKDNFWKENKQTRENKWKLGSSIDFTGPRRYRDVRHKIKEDANIQDGTDLLNEKNFDKIVNETWFFFPKAIHPKDFFIDDAAYGQPDVQYADDCIYKEKVTASEFNRRYGDNKAFMNAEKVQYWQDINPKNKDDKSIDVRHVVLYHYFHRLTKKYLIFANEQFLIYNGLYLYDDGKLPFVNTQHYSNSERFWGEGIPERVAFLKIYKSEILQDILTGAAMSSGVHLVVGNDDQVGQDWTIGGRGLNLLRTTGGADKVQAINTSPNLGYFTQVLALLDKEIIAASGINPLSQVESQAATLGQEELIEANKAIRNSSVDENYNIGLDEKLTMMLDRIKQFAPALLSRKEYGSDGKLLKTIFPKIRIDNYEVKREGGKQVMEDNIGKFGYFELKPGVVQGVGVKVTTASTNSILPILERQKVTEFINNVTAIANVAALDQTGAQLKTLFEFAKLTELTEWMGDAYGYDINGLKATTEKDKIAKKNREKIKQLREMIAEPVSNPSQNAQEPVASPVGSPVPGGSGAAQGLGGAAAPQAGGAQAGAGGTSVGLAGMQL